MGLRELAKNLGLTEPRTLALIHYLELQKDVDCYWEFRMAKSTVFKRYSPLALNRLKQGKETVDMDLVWKQYRLR